MGDRSNIHIVGKDFGPTGIYFYTHWSGAGVYDSVRAALAKKWRWDDGPYLARIIFCQLVHTDANYCENEHSFGISAVICDNEHSIIHVDVDKQTVRVSSKVWTFEEYLHSAGEVEPYDTGEPDDFAVPYSPPTTVDGAWQ